MPPAATSHSKQSRKGKPKRSKSESEPESSEQGTYKGGKENIHTNPSSEVSAKLRDVIRKKPVRSRLLDLFLSQRDKTGQHPTAFDGKYGVFKL